MSLKLGECAVCFEDIKIGGTLKCGHVLDYECLKCSLLVLPETCPVCRQRDDQPPVKLFFDEGLGPDDESGGNDINVRKDGQGEMETQFRSNIFRTMQESLAEAQSMLGQALAQLSKEQDEKEKVSKKYRVLKDQLAKNMACDSARRKTAEIPLCSIPGSEFWKAVTDLTEERGRTHAVHVEIPSNRPRLGKRPSQPMDSSGSEVSVRASTSGSNSAAGSSNPRRRSLMPSRAPTSSLLPPSSSNHHRSSGGAEGSRNRQASSERRPVVVIDVDSGSPRKRRRQSS
ncbi:uncharacterized protein EI90DRAFT_2088771 [Cantharellus anzutake]|uniref:uncharacterized protein n=1 Tax=Cantharellus anzutake TaxID=1750568 RepID=UPI0019073A6E|nr:uncharacterized protein EI90DRAFT_2088771 [Cantharellus anzutake]KAF8340624.1 hypothetical protein EI90DRAFT_2088771 [Cantharellus anzutake]